MKISFSYTSKDGLHGYVIHGAAVTEVEIDVLTGEKQVGFESPIGSQLTYSSDTTRFAELTSLRTLVKVLVLLLILDKSKEVS